MRMSPGGWATNQIRVRVRIRIWIWIEIESCEATFLDYANRFTARSVCDSRLLFSHSVDFALALATCLPSTLAPLSALARTLCLLLIRGGLARLNYALLTCLCRFFGATNAGDTPLSLSLSFAARVCVCVGVLWILMVRVLPITCATFAYVLLLCTRFRRHLFNYLD